MVKVYAISMLVDLVHSIRSELSIGQLAKVIDFYTGCMNDISLTPTIHTMCVKILFYIVDSVIKIPEKEKGMYFLSVYKYVSLYWAVQLVGSVPLALSYTRS